MAPSQLHIVFPSLQELCGSVIHLHNLDYEGEKFLPQSIKRYLSEMVSCCYCKKWYEPINKGTCGRVNCAEKHHDFVWSSIRSSFGIDLTTFEELERYLYKDDSEVPD